MSNTEVHNNNFEEVKTPSQVAKSLSISVATLRKYSLLIEKTTGQSNYFERNKQNMRLYTKANVSELRKLIRLSKKDGMTLNDAVIQLYGISDASTPQVSPVVHANNQNQSQNQNLPSTQLAEMLTNMNQLVEEQAKTIKELQDQLTNVQKQNAVILTKLDDSPLFESNEEAISDVKHHVTKTQTEKQYVTEKQVLADPNVAEESPQVHPRTLADMQVPSERKPHWWQRFFDSL